MDRRRLVVTTGTVALMLAAGTAWAGPPPPPPPGSGGGEVRSAPPPPSSASKAGSDAKSSSDKTPSDPLSIDQRTPDTDLTGTWGYNRGGSRGPNYVRSVEDDPFFTVNPVGFYQGVSSTGGAMPPYAPKEIGGESAVLTWTGFERTDTSSRVFFQLSAAVEPEVVAEGLAVTIKLPRTSIKVRNNRRALITKYFKTPVDRVKVRRKGKDVIATLVLRWEATPTWTVNEGERGYKILVFEFPDTQDMQDAPAPPSAPEAPPHPSPPAKDASSDESGEAPFLPTD